LADIKSQKKLKQKTLNRYGIQDDSCLKVDILSAVFDRFETTATTTPGTNDMISLTDRVQQAHLRQNATQAFFVKIRMDNQMRQEDQT